MQQKTSDHYYIYSHSHSWMRPWVSQFLYGFYNWLNFQRCEKITIPSRLTSTTGKLHSFAAQTGAELLNWKRCDWKCFTLLLRCSGHYLVQTVKKPMRNVSTFSCLARLLYGRSGAHLLLVVATWIPSKEQMSPAGGSVPARPGVAPPSPRQLPAKITIQMRPTLHTADRARSRGVPGGICRWKRLTSPCGVLLLVSEHGAQS